MKKEYDFCKGERGKFYKKDAKYNIPIYLDDLNYTFVDAVASKKNIAVSQVVNDLIETD